MKFEVIQKVLKEGNFKYRQKGKRFFFDDMRLDCRNPEVCYIYVKDERYGIQPRYLFRFLRLYKQMKTKSNWMICKDFKLIHLESDWYFVKTDIKGLLFNSTKHFFIKIENQFPVVVLGILITILKNSKHEKVNLKLFQKKVDRKYKNTKWISEFICLVNNKLYIKTGNYIFKVRYDITTTNEV